MKKDIDIKGRIVNMYDIDTGAYENEVIKYLDKQMKVRFHSVFFNNSRYTFFGTPAEQESYSITISSYKKRDAGDKSSVVIK